MRGRPTEVPDGLPILARGRHSGATQGACVMEFAAYLAGEPYTDRPATVHPLIAAVARVTNDSISDSRRRELMQLIPRMLNTEREDQLLVSALVTLCCRRGLEVAPPIWAPQLRRGLHAKPPRRDRSVTASQRAAHRAERRVTIAAASVAFGTLTHRDEAMTGLLTDCLTLIENWPASGQDSRPQTTGHSRKQPVAQ